MPEYIKKMIAEQMRVSRTRNGAVLRGSFREGEIRYDKIISRTLMASPACQNCEISSMSGWRSKHVIEVTNRSAEIAIDATNVGMILI
jgi:delta-aminolevulinic acid dehydratase/porphobilinogen synthase